MTDLDQLAAAQKDLARSMAKILSRLDYQDQRAEELRLEVKKLNHLITGNGTPESGIWTRLHDVEQESKRRANWTKATIIACITAVVSTLFSVARHWVEK